jgi:uncharacterized protein (TIGR03067 family)
MLDLALRTRGGTMRRTTLLGLALLLIGAAPPGDAASEEAARLRGTWLLVASEADGEREAADVRVLLVITRDKVTLRAKGVRDESGFRLRPAKTPKEIDLIRTGERDPEREGVALAIYQLRGDELTICGNAVGSKQRPKAFRTQARDGLTLGVFKRQK